MEVPSRFRFGRGAYNTVCGVDGRFFSTAGWTGRMDYCMQVWLRGDVRGFREHVKWGMLCIWVGQDGLNCEGLWE